MSELEAVTELIKLVGAGGGSVGAYLLASKLPIFNGKKGPPSIPCAPLQVVQSEVEHVRKSNAEQWGEIRSISKSVSEIKGTTDTILERMPKP